MEMLGKFFQSLRGASRLWLIILLVLLAAFVGLNFVIRPHHPHVEAEKIPGFWAVFALVCAVGMGGLMKGFVAEVLGVSEDHYVPKPQAPSAEDLAADAHHAPHAHEEEH